MDKKKLVLWSLCNFGGGIIEIAFILYFSQWLVIDRGLPDAWFNATLIISSIMVLLASPVLSYWGDEGGQRLRGLQVGVLGSTACFAAVGLVATLYPQQALLAAAFFTVGLFFYLSAGVFWCSLLPDIATPTYFGRASGWGQFGAWLGQVFALLLLLPFVSGTITLFGAPGRAQAFLPATIVFVMCAALILLQYDAPPVSPRPRIRLKAAYASSIRQFLEIAKTNGLGWFFLAFFLFNDAIITAANNFPLYLERVFGVSDMTKSLLLLGILSAAVVGSLLGGWLTDRIGHRRALLSNLALWVLVLPIMAAIHNFALFSGVAVFMGVLFGSIWVVARTLVARLTPERALSRAYAYYILMERFATLIGPLAWLLVLSFAGGANGPNYRAALVSMTVFVVIGALLALKVPAHVQRQTADSLVS